MKRIARTTASMLLLGSNATIANAANLVTNPNFATDLSGWTVSSSGTASVTFESTSGSPTAGSIRLQATNGGIAHAVQCVAVSQQNHDLIARRYVAVATGDIMEADANVIVYDQPGCISSIVGFIAFNIATGFAGTLNGSPQTWDEISDTNVPFPVGAASASVNLYVAANAGGVVDLYFDDVRFGPTGTTPVQLQSFDVR